MESRIRGNFTQRAFSELLFDLWQLEKTGLLNSHREGIERKLAFQKGQLAVTTSVFSEKNFLDFLCRKEILDSSSIEACERFAAENQCSSLHALHEISPLRPSLIWSLLEEFIKEEAFPLFDWEEGDYEFDQENIPHEADILLLIPTLSFILQGVRQMNNHQLFQRRVPQPEEAIQFLSPLHLDQIKLSPPEKYVWNLVKTEKNLKNLYQASVLGRRESQRVIFALSSLGLISFSQEKIREASCPKSSEILLDRMLNVFNAKFSCIYKYISKELGPVAFNLVEKSLEDVRSHLSPHLREVEFDNEGRLPIDSILKANLTYTNEETKMSLLQDLNEILVSEVLAVKKNLGHDHESVLVNILEKIREKD